MKNTVIFDFDGTLVNSLYDIHDSVNHVLSEMNMPLRSFEHVESVVGEGYYRLMQRCVPEGTDKETIDKAAEDFKLWYLDHGNIKTRPYDGIIDLLKKLKENNINTAISSNKYGPMVKELSDRLFGNLIDLALGECETVAKKPDPQSAYAALDFFKVSKENAIYVGDSEVDIKTAKNAGIDLICVSWGARSKDLLIQEGAPIIVDDAPSLLQAILSFK